MRVTVERSLGVAILSLVTGEVPDDQSLVAGGRQEHVGAIRSLVLHGGSQAGDPAILYPVSMCVQRWKILTLLWRQAEVIE